MTMVLNILSTTLDRMTSLSYKMANAFAGLLIVLLSMLVILRGIDMLEFIGLCTCIYLAWRLFPMAIKFGIKLAVALLIVLFLFLVFQIGYHYWLTNYYLMGLIA